MEVDGRRVEVVVKGVWKVKTQETKNARIEKNKVPQKTLLECFMLQNKKWNELKSHKLINLIPDHCGLYVLSRA